MGDNEGEVGKGLDPDFINKVKAWSDRAEETKKKGQQLGLGLPGDEDAPDPEATGAIAPDLQNPDESHRLYYAIQRLLKDTLPPGPDNEELRRVVYDEKNLYINRGKDLDENGIRGSDGRMGYIPHLRIALKKVRAWSEEAGSAFDIFMEFWEINDKLGYHKGTKKREKPLKIQGTPDDVLRAAMSDKPKGQE